MAKKTAKQIVLEVYPDAVVDSRWSETMQRRLYELHFGENKKSFICNDFTERKCWNGGKRFIERMQESAREIKERYG